MKIAYILPYFILPLAACSTLTLPPARQSDVQLCYQQEIIGGVSPAVSGEIARRELDCRSESMLKLMEIYGREEASQRAAIPRPYTCYRNGPMTNCW